MKRILLPTDFSDNSKNAIHHAIHLYSDDNAEFILFHSFFTPHTSPHASQDAIDSVREESIIAFDQLIKEINKQANREISFSRIFRYGALVDAVKAIIEEEEIDLIVMGTQGASGLEEVLVGSSTSNVIKSVKCPVLTIPEKSSYRKPQKIVFAVDQQHEPLGNVIGPMIDLAQKFDAEILMLHVDGKDSTYDETEIKSYMRGVNFSYHTVQNEHTIKGMETFIQEHDADILAMVTHDESLIERLFHPSITKKMSMHTKVPLLAMHEK